MRIRTLRMLKRRDQTRIFPAIRFSPGQPGPGRNYNPRTARTKLLYITLTIAPLGRPKAILLAIMHTAIAGGWRSGRGRARRPQTPLSSAWRPRAPARRGAATQAMCRNASGAQSSRSGNAADARPPPRPAGRLVLRLAICYAGRNMIGKPENRQQKVKLFLRSPFVERR
jgi:hypothetical protein